MPGVSPQVLIMIGSKAFASVSIRRVTVNEEGGLLSSEIEVRADVWKGAYQGQFYPGELLWLAGKLEELHAALAGTVTFSATDGVLDLTFEGDGKGHIGIYGKAETYGSADATLTFRFDIDQTELPPIIASLKEFSNF